MRKQKTKMLFLQERDPLEKDIKRLNDERDAVTVAAKNWRETATDVFMFARYAKEDFDSDDWERKRTVIKKMGADLILSSRTIQFAPAKYLVPIENSRLQFNAENNLARTASEQMKKGLKEDLIELWYTR